MADTPQDDFTIHTYQDDLDSGDENVDQATNELGDDPTKELGVPPEEFKNELDNLVVEGNNSLDGTEDARERVEDLDQDEGDSTKY